jgi:hypothetical protein
VIPSAVGRISVPPSPPRSGGERRPFAPRRASAEGGPATSTGELAGGVALAAGLKGLMGFAQDTCRLRAVSPDVQIIEYATPERRRMAVHGVHTCKSPLCPLCAPKWQRTRSDEISRAIDRWEPGADGVFFVTLTMRHNRKMRLALQHRLLTAAFGSLWGGNAGKKASRKLGGKPESVRAHDRTWSRRRGWHPHIHALLFARDAELSTSELAALLDKRWPIVLAAALRRFRLLCERIISRSDAIEGGMPSGRGGCGRVDCPVCQVPFVGPRQEITHAGPLREDEPPRTWRGRKLGAFPLPAGEQQGECQHFRERAQRLFGVRMFPRKKREIQGQQADGSPRYVERVVPIHDSALKVLAMLEPFTPESIKPTRAHGAFVERMRDKDRLPSYLAKLGLEVAWSLDKAGKIGSDGVRHYGHWEVARLATTHGHDDRPAARRAWSELFWATRGTQTITFSDREALGLDADPYADGAEPPERAADETSRCIATIPAPVYREQVAAREHGVLSELARAYERGELAALAYVEHPGAAGRPLRSVPSERGPPATADPSAVDGDGYLEQRPEPWSPGDVLPFDEKVSARVARSEAGDATIVSRAYRDATALPSPDPFPAQRRRELRETIYGLGESRRADGMGATGDRGAESAGASVCGAVSGRGNGGRSDADASRSADPDCDESNAGERGAGDGAGVGQFAASTTATGDPR